MVLWVPYFHPSSQQEAYQLVGQAKLRATKILPKAAFSAVFFNFEKFRPEVNDAIISGMAEY